MDLLLHKLLKVVTTASLVYCVDALWVVNVLDQVPQLARGIPRQPRESRFLPEASQEVEVVRMFTAVTAGTSWPHVVPRHDMDGDGGGGGGRLSSCRSADISA